MSEKYVNHVNFPNGRDIMDLRGDTIVPEVVVKGYKGHDGEGKPFVGTLVLKDEQEKTVSITKNGTTEVKPDNGKALSKVTVKVNVPTEGGSGGSGIIDVTELPTSGIDENAVYRLTESYMSANTDVWVVLPDEVTGELAVVNIRDAIGECDIYVVDTMEDMVATNLEEEGNYVLNVLRADGIAYILIPDIGVPLPLGAVILGVEDLDKGYTQDPYLETEIGIYTTQEQNGSFQRFFIRENGEWKEVSAHIIATSQSGESYVEVLSGEYSSDKKIPLQTQLNAPYMGDLVENGYPEVLPAEWFVNSKGEPITKISYHTFYNESITDIELPESLILIDESAFERCTKLTNIRIPRNVAMISPNVFRNCDNLTTVTFAGVPEHIAYNIFDSCRNLTTINVPWSEGDPVNNGAPWGATDATINYNYTEG